ncbi:MAG: 6-bladed beta-propeller, partial [Pedobacter sp.]
MKTLRLDPSTARGAAASQVFDEVKFIPLETTKESLFGSISQFVVTDGNYIVYDYD